MKLPISLLVLFLSSSCLAECDVTAEDIIIFKSADFLQKDAVVTLKCIVGSSEAEKYLIEIERFSNLTAQLYAAIGYREIGSKAYPSTISRLKNNSTSITYYGGDYIRDSTVRDEAVAIEKGEYSFAK